ncbi:MAG: sulfite exporter TauE/SafE family protein [Bdellovibrionota bacterium]
MSQHHEFYFIIVAFVAEFIGSISGVSSSALFVPLARLFETMQVTLVLTAVLHVLGNSIRAVMYRKNIDWGLTIKFGLPAIVFSGLGAQYSDYLPERFYSLFLGLFLISLSTYFLFFETKNLFVGSKWLPYMGGALSGLLTGLLGSGGAVRSLALTVFNLNPLAFVATSTLIDFGGDIVRLVVYLKKDYLGSEHYFYIPLLMLVVVIANWLGKLILTRIPEERFRKLVLFFVMAMGFVSLISGIGGFYVV